MWLKEISCKKTIRDEKPDKGRESKSERDRTNKKLRKWRLHKDGQTGWTGRRQNQFALMVIPVARLPSDLIRRWNIAVDSIKPANEGANTSLATRFEHSFFFFPLLFSSIRASKHAKTQKKQEEDLEELCKARRGGKGSSLPGFFGLQERVFARLGFWTARCLVCEGIDSLREGAKHQG